MRYVFFACWWTALTCLLCEAACWTQPLRHWRSWDNPEGLIGRTIPTHHASPSGHLLILSMNSYPNYVIHNGYESLQLSGSDIFRIARVGHSGHIWSMNLDIYLFKKIGLSRFIYENMITDGAWKDYELGDLLEGIRIDLPYQSIPFIPLDAHTVAILFPDRLVKYSIHADTNPLRFQAVFVFYACKLIPLIRLESLRFAPLERVLQCFHTKHDIQRIGQVPGQHIPAVPVHHTKYRYPCCRGT